MEQMAAVLMHYSEKLWFILLYGTNTSERQKPTCDLCVAAATPTAALTSQRWDFSLKYLQSVQKFFHAGQVLSTAAGLPRYIYAVSEDDLVLSIDYLLSDVTAWWRRFKFGLNWCAFSRVHIHWAPRAAGNIDVVDVIKNHRAVHGGQGDVMLFTRSRRLSSMT